MIEQDPVPVAALRQRAGDGTGDGLLLAAAGDDVHVLARFQRDAHTEEHQLARQRNVQQAPLTPVERRDAHEASIAITTQDDVEPAPGRREVSPPRTNPAPAQEKGLLAAVAEKLVPFRTERVQPVDGRHDFRGDV